MGLGIIGVQTQDECGSSINLLGNAACDKAEWAYLRPIFRNCKPKDTPRQSTWHMQGYDSNPVGFNAEAQLF